VANLYVITENFALCFLNVYLILTARLPVTSSMRCTFKKHSTNVLLLVTIAEGQDILTENPLVLENDNDTVIVNIHHEKLIATVTYFVQLM